MNYLVKKIDPMSAAKIAAVCFGCISLVFIPFSLLMIFDPTPKDSHVPSAFSMLFIFLPIFYIIMGFIMTYTACAVYNFVSEKFGPVKIRLEVEEIKN